MAVPENMNSVSAYLIVPDAREALSLYEKALGAKPGLVMEMPDGSVMHAEMHIGNSVVMLSNENPEWGAQAPATLGGTPVSMHVYVDDVDAAYQQAVDAGFTTQMPPTDMFWGDRFTKLTDPLGHQWSLATQTQQLTEEEIKAGQAKWMEEMAAQQGGDAGC